MQASVTLTQPEHVPKSYRSFAWSISAERLLLVLLLLFFSIRGIIPAWRHLNSDFASYYLAARLYREGYPLERVYEWEWFQRQKDHAGISRPFVGFIPSTPTSVLPIVPLSSLSPEQASHLWLVANLGLLLAVVLLLKAITSLTWRRLSVLTFLAVAPLHSDFLLGQVHLVVLFLITLAAWMYFRDWPFLSGIVLTAAAAMKIYPVLFLVFFLLKKQWRAASGLALGTAAVVALSLGCFGVGACRIYWREVLPWGLRGDVVDPYAIGWDSLNALLHRLFIFEPELNPAPIAHLPSVYSLLYPLISAFIAVSYLWAIGSKSSDPSRRKLEWASYCFLLLLLSSQPLPYHFVLLILTAALVTDYLVAERRAMLSGLVVVIYTLVCLPYDRLYRLNPSGWKSVFFFPRLWFMLLLAAILFRLLVSESENFSDNRLRRRVAMRATVAYLTMFTVGVVFNFRHQDGQFDNYKMRVTTSIGSAIAIDPVVTADTVFFGSLVPKFVASGRDEYVIRTLHDQSLASFGGVGDWFHPAATQNGQSWAEVASSNSRIVRFDSASPSSGNQPFVVEVVDAETPVVSSSGELLMYLREMRGRGSLWIRWMKGERKPAFNQERELADPHYDVREAAFSADNQIAFSSWAHERYELFAANPATGAITRMSSVTCSARYPAFSADGKWMAFSCESSGVWQLVVMNLRSLQQRQLTTSDCNSITPVWTLDSKDLIYATDCGRALGITALARLKAVR
jgi:Glycosyltransferase family 87/WD40-like Beta Propeller Repeat